jgi:hypothetical protein
MAHFMQLATAQAKSEDEYFVDGEPVPNNAIRLVYGYIVRGEAVVPQRVEVVKRKVDECDMCNAMTVCTFEVRNGAGKYLMACNHCIKHSPDLVMKYPQLPCYDCTYTRCTHNPQSARQAADKRPAGT